MRCRWYTDAEVGRLHVPGCMGAAVYGPGGCTCGRKDSRRDIEAEIERLSERVTQLEREKRTYSSSQGGGEK